MAASMTVLWLGAALLGGAFSLTCFTCNSTGITCEENEKVCDAKQDVCMSTLSLYRLDKSKPVSSLLEKSCGEKKHCNKNYSMSFNVTQIFVSVSCCETDKCKTTTPEVQIQGKESQLKCPFCYGPASKCSDTVKASCFLGETKCVSFTSKSKEDINSNVIHKWKGCATEDVCSMATLPTALKHSIQSAIQCENAASQLPGLFFPVAFGLALLKLLL